ncbi:MAG: phosphoenolpyruvate synthase [Epsilonproteobacteria bacterium]|nr:phosphoenolpyruvate synthase [Campylobacterota bacterium]
MQFIKHFDSIRMTDIAQVGGKNASLGEMIHALSSKNVLIPSGFAITANAYWKHLHDNNLTGQIKTLLGRIDKKKLDTLSDAGKQIRTLITKAPLPDEIVAQVTQAYQELEKKYGKQCDVAVRSSATAEDLPDASFAGQQETFLNIQGIDALLAVCSRAFASLFTNRAISYRIDKGFNHMDIALSIGVQKMVRSDKACAGVIFTLDTESGFKDVVYITSSYGLGETVVQGSVDPDEFYVHKPTLEQGHKPILKKRLGSKTIKMIYTDAPAQPTKIVDVESAERLKYSLSEQELLDLAHQAVVIENYYAQLKGTWSPMDIEWAKDGNDGKLYIVQARPETVHSRQENSQTISEYSIANKASLSNKIVVKGKSVGRKIVVGNALVIQSPEKIGSVKQGDIIVTDMTDPDWEPIMKLAGGIITNRGGRTCHAAIVSRELGIPAIVGTGNGTEKIKTGQEITLNCSSGEVGIVYDGAIPFQVKQINVQDITKPSVEIFMNLGNPDEAFNLANLPVDGIGLARLEFIINSSIQVHPMALVCPEKVTDPGERDQIDKLTIEYNDKKQFFIDKLAQEAGTIAAAFYPKPVIFRLSDFKSNEYRKLVGGQFFEPEEENPMIGFRGASRYFHDLYRDAFALECLAMKKIRLEMGLTNAILMIPFVRTIAEGQAVIEEMKKHGLERGRDNLEIYMMVEVPSNVILIDEFSKLFDGFSIGSNDLTQLTLAVDRDSALVSNIFDERNEAVEFMLKAAIEGAKRNNKKVGICGQAPSDYPELARSLQEWGIHSLSLNPDSILQTIRNFGSDN